MNIPPFNSLKMGMLVRNGKFVTGVGIGKFKKLWFLSVFRTGFDPQKTGFAASLEIRYAV